MNGRVGAALREGNVAIEVDVNGTSSQCLRPERQREFADLLTSVLPFIHLEEMELRVPFLLD